MQYKKWTPEEDQYLKDKFEHTSNQILRKHLDRTRPSINSRARKLGLQKGEEFISEVKRRIAANRTYDNIEFQGDKINVHADMIKFGNTLDKENNFKSVLPLFTKYGKEQFKKLYKLHTS